jgi:hypothetical protein
MSSKVVLEKRRPDTGSVAEMRAKNEGWHVSAKALGESVHQDPRINSRGAMSWFSSGQDLRCDSPSSGTTRSHHRLRPAGGSRWQRVASGLGPTSCDLYCSAGGRNCAGVVQVFGRWQDVLSTRSCGRRPKSAKARNRGWAASQVGSYLGHTIPSAVTVRTRTASSGCASREAPAC